MRYTAVIRTLGTAGDKYQKMLDSLVRQSIRPEAIIVYIAEEYDMPKETVGIERYVKVRKGMVSQRALPYTEVKTEYVLFLDDDVYLPENSVKTLYEEMAEYGGQVISPCVFGNHKISLRDKMRLSLLGREYCRIHGGRWGYKVMRSAGFSYNNNPVKAVYESQTNAGPCFFCRKDDFLRIRFEEELWIEKTPYAYPEDQVMFYKMYCVGLKQLTSFDSGIVHLDAGSSLRHTIDRTKNVVYSEYRNKLVFWHRFIFMPEDNLLGRLLSCVALAYTFGIQMFKYSIFYTMGQKEQAVAFRDGIIDGMAYIRSDEYERLPLIKKR